MRAAVDKALELALIALMLGAQALGWVRALLRRPSLEQHRATERTLAHVARETREHDEVVVRRLLAEEKRINARTPRAHSWN